MLAGWARGLRPRRGWQSSVSRAGSGQVAPEEVAELSREWVGLDLPYVPSTCKEPLVEVRRRAAAPALGNHRVWMSGAAPMLALVQSSTGNTNHRDGSGSMPREVRLRTDERIHDDVHLLV